MLLVPIWCVVMSPHDVSHLPKELFSTSSPVWKQHSLLDVLGHGRCTCHAWLDYFKCSRLKGPRGPRSGWRRLCFLGSGMPHTHPCCYVLHVSQSQVQSWEMNMYVKRFLLDLSGCSAGVLDTEVLFNLHPCLFLRAHMHICMHT